MAVQAAKVHAPAAERRGRGEAEPIHREALRAHIRALLAEPAVAASVARRLHVPKAAAPEALPKWLDGFIRGEAGGFARVLPRPHALPARLVRRQRAEF